MPKIKNHLIPICIITLLGLLPLSYFKDGLLILGGDQGYQLLSPAFHLRNSYIWDIVQGAGFYNPLNALSAPNLIFLSLLKAIKVPLFISEALLLCFLFIGAGLSMYFLAGSLFNRRSKLLALSSAIFYMVNPYAMLNWGAPDFIALSAYAMYPLLFALFVRGIRSKTSLRSGFFFALGSLILVAGNAHFQFTIIIFLTLLFYSIFYLAFLKNGEQRVQALRFVFIAIVFYLLLNLWWLLPLLPSYAEGIQKLAAMNPTKWLRGFSSYSSILHLFQLYGYPGWESYNWGRPAFAYVPTIVNNPFFIFLSFFPPILLGVALILRSSVKNRTVNEKNNEKNFLFFIFLYLVSIFLAKGTQPPLGGAFYWLFEHLPGFTIFRSGFVNFGIMIALSLALLFGASLDILYKYIKNVRTNVLRVLRIEVIMVVALITLILVWNYPFFTGEVIISGKGALPSFHHRIPGYYYKTAEWINNQGEDVNVFSFYGGGGEWVTYDWGGGDTYIGVDMTPNLIHKMKVHASASENPFANNIYSLLLNDQTKRIGRLLNLLNVKYILLHNDSDPKWYGSTPPQVIKKKLLAQKDIYLQKSFGKLDLYRNENWTSMHIYAPQTLTYVRGGISDLASVVSFDDFKIKNAFFFTDLLKNKQRQFALSKSNEILVTSTPVFVRSKGKKYAQDRYVVSDEGKYEILVNAGGWTKSEDTKPLLLVLDGKIVAHRVPIFRSDGWISVGDFSFKKGKYHIYLYKVNERGEDIPVDGVYVLRKSKPANSRSPRIFFTKINPTKYIVQVSEAKSPYLLVFSEPFHSGWKAYIRDKSSSKSPVWETWFKKPVPESRHFLVNRYANSWWIDHIEQGKQTKGSYEIILEFRPQRLFYLALMVSGITLLFCLVFLITLFFRKQLVARK